MDEEDLNFDLGDEYEGEAEMDVEQRGGDENNDPCNCIIERYEKHKKEYLKKNIHFEKFFELLESLKAPNFSTEYYSLCSQLARHHNDKICSSNEDLFDIDGSENETYELLTIPTILRHIYLKVRSVKMDLYLETQDLNQYLRMLRKKENLFHVNHNGFVTANKDVLNSIERLNRIRNSNVRLSYDISK